jgi:predicted amidohydrolase YtcJ
MPLSPARLQADIVLTGGKIVTLDARSTTCQALAASGGRVLATGTDAEIEALAGEGTERIRLGGRTVIPGLVDGHAHMDNEGLKTLLPSLSHCQSISDVQATIAELARAAQPGAWIVTMPIGTPPYYRDGADMLAERRYPTRYELDEAAPDHPVYIKPILGYWRGLGGFPLVSIANSRALNAAGITRETVPPWAGIQIDRDYTRRPIP